jgi:hypothetical protein
MLRRLDSGRCLGTEREKVHGQGGRGMAYGQFVLFVRPSTFRMGSMRVGDC